MPEQIVTPSKPTILNTASQVAKPVNPNDAPKVETPPIKTEVPKQESKVESPTVTSADILKRQSTTKTEEVKQSDGSILEIDTKAIYEGITDPNIKAILDKKIKDLESGANKKYQAFAQKTKELDDLKSRINTWTPQRLAEELRKPEFVQAMQILQQQAPPQGWEGSSEEWSGLSDSDKKQIQQMRQEQQSLQAQLAQMHQKEEDSTIKTLYPDYDPQVVDEAIEGLRTGQITASRADIWKVVNHDKNVEKGYQFGYEDGYKKALEKLNGATHMNGNLNVTGADDVPDDVRKGGFSSIAMWRLQRSKGSQKK